MANGVTTTPARPTRRAPPARADLGHVEVWVFDLDNTLYHPTRCDLFPEMDRRMNAFIAEMLAITQEAANERRRLWYDRHGTTMNGLMREHGIDPTAFLDFVHDLDLSLLCQDEQLDRALAALPGRKVIFTNATERHARNVTEKLGVAHHFDGVFDVVAAEYEPKPDVAAYRRFLARHGVDPRGALMFEGMARNLAPAAALGMTTVWVETPRLHARPADEDSHVHYETDDLTTWLQAVAGLEVSKGG